MDITQCGVKRELPSWLSGTESIGQCGRCRLNPWVGTIPRRRKWQASPGEKAYGQTEICLFLFTYIKIIFCSSDLGLYFYIINVLSCCLYFINIELSFAAGVCQLYLSNESHVANMCWNNRQACRPKPQYKPSGSTLKVHPPSTATFHHPAPVTTVQFPGIWTVPVAS